MQALTTLLFSMMMISFHLRILRRGQGLRASKIIVTAKHCRGCSHSHRAMKVILWSSNITFGTSKSWDKNSGVPSGESQYFSDGRQTAALSWLWITIQTHDQVLRLIKLGMFVTREYTFSRSSTFLEQFISNSYITGGTWSIEAPAISYAFTKTDRSIPSAVSLNWNNMTLIDCLVHYWAENA